MTDIDEAEAEITFLLGVSGAVVAERRNTNTQNRNEQLWDSGRA